MNGLDLDTITWEFLGSQIDLVELIGSEVSDYVEQDIIDALWLEFPELIPNLIESGIYRCLKGIDG